MNDLAGRPNPSQWSSLLKLALPVIEHAYGGIEDPSRAARWTLGGGTAIALRIAHRISDDVDIFVGAKDLREFIPMRNPLARSLQADMQFPGNYLKFIREDGEIDFLPGPLISSPGYTWRTFAKKPIALQTCEEVILKKVRYRATSFKARDAFDLVAVARSSASLSGLLTNETGDRLPTMLTALQRHTEESLKKADIRPLPGFEDLARTAIAEASQYTSDLIAKMKGLDQARDARRSTAPASPKSSRNKGSGIGD